jgi:hypothetical protein
MNPSVVKLARLFAWTAAIAACAVLVFGYGALPEQMPVTRWSAAPKTLWGVLRVPAINLVCVLILALFERALARAHAVGPHRESALRLMALLYALAGTKAFLEALELLLYPKVFPALTLGLPLLVVAGLAAAAWTGRVFLKRATRPALAWTRDEVRGLAAAILALLGLQFLPVWL